MNTLFADVFFSGWFWREISLASKKPTCSGLLIYETQRLSQISQKISKNRYQLRWKTLLNQKKRKYFSKSDFDLLLASLWSSKSKKSTLTNLSKSFKYNWAWLGFRVPWVKKEVQIVAVGVSPTCSLICFVPCKIGKWFALCPPFLMVCFHWWRCTTSWGTMNDYPNHSSHLGWHMCNLRSHWS